MLDWDSVRLCTSRRLDNHINPTRMYGPFFDDRLTTEAFLLMQKNTGSLVSGPVVFKCLAGLPVGDEVLDLFVPQEKAREVGFFLGCGTHAKFVCRPFLLYGDAATRLETPLGSMSRLLR